MATNPREQINGDLPQNDEIPEIPQLKRPDWRRWREKGTGRIWYASMLSLNLHPSVENRTLLKTIAPETYEEFKHRSEVAIHRYGRHAHLPTIQHVRAGERPPDQFVEYEKFLAFAKEMNWSDLSAFEEGISGNKPTSSENTTRHTTDDLPKGERYDLVRTGALLVLLERVLSGDRKVDEKLLFSGAQLNISQVSKELHEIITSVARQNEKNSVAGFGVEANRKRLTAAANALRDAFRTA